MSKDLRGAPGVKSGFVFTLWQCSDDDQT